MKAIQLVTYEKPEFNARMLGKSVFSVSLGPDHKYEFNSEKACKRFLAEASRYFTFKAVEFNEIYIDMFRFYREAWFYMDEGRKRETNFLLMDYKMPGYLSNMEDIFKNLMKESPQRNYFIMRNFIRLHQIITSFTGDIIRMYDTKNMPLLVYRCRTIEKRSNRTMRSLEQFGSASRIRSKDNPAAVPIVAIRSA